ncbi:MAG: DUF748 domain-containing protein [Rhodospirillales bacterium]|nr:DUF748 domain-containing protein [Rhodospirillales bacterium]
MRLLRILAGLVGGIVVLVLGFVALAPDMAARLVAGRAAAWSGIEAQGLGTLDLSLSEARISGGPLSFGEGAGEPVRVGQVRADLDGRALFAGRVVVEELFLADTDAEIAIDGQGRAKLNGIALGASGEPAAGDPSQGRGAPFPAIDIKRANIEQLRLTLRRGPNPPYPLLLDRLRLSDLSAETPDNPASFEIAGSGGDVRFSYSGEAKPYRQPIEAILSGGFENLSLADVDALAGPLGLSRAEGRLAAQGKHRLTLSANGGQTVSNEGTLSARGIDVAAPGLDALRLDEAHLRLDGSATVGAHGRVEFANRAPWTVAGLVAAWSETGALKVAEATLDLDLAGHLAAETGLAAKIRGSVPLRGHVVAWSETGDVRLDDGTMRVDIDVTAAPDGAMRISGPMALKGDGGGLRSGESFRLSYRGIDVDFPDAAIEIAADGTARVDGRPLATFSGFALAAPTHLEAATAIATSGSLHVVSPAEGVLVEFRGGLDLRDAAAPLDEARRLRAEALAFELADMRYDEEPSGAARMTSDIAARAAAVRTEGKDARPFPLRDGTLRLAGLDLALTADGGIRRLALAPETEAVLEGYARGRPHHLTLGLDRLEITDLDPGVSDQLTRADIVVSVNESGRIELSEQVKPFIRPPEFLFEGSVRDLELPQLSPYVAAFTGFDVDSGRVEATGRATAESGKLDGVVDLDIQTLELVPAAKTGDAVARDLIGVPVDLAIALLENAKRQIVVSLPFSGDLSDPEVDYCDVIRTALLGAVRLVVTAVVPGTGGKGKAQGLQPVPFDAGSSAVSADGGRQLDQIGGMLAGKPRLRLQVCGRATAADARALGAAPTPGAPQGAAAADQSPKLLALAQERSRVAVARLAAVPGVRPDQVQECRPSVDARDAGAGRADVRF